jgi:Major Facilitator Superfamily.
MFRKVMFENKNARCYILGSFVISIGTGIFFLVLNLYLKNKGVSNEIIGFVNALYYLGIATLSIVSGIISNIAGHKNSFILGTLLQSLGEILLLFSKSTFSLLLSILLIGFGASLFLVNEPPFLSRNSTTYEQTHLFTISFGSIILGNFIGEILGTLVPALSKSNFYFGLRNSILFSATLSMMSLLFISRIEESWIQEEEESIISKIKDPLKKLAKNIKYMRVISTFALSEFFMGVGAGIMIPFFNLYFLEYQNIAPEKLGFIFGIQSILIAFSSIYLPTLFKNSKKFYVILTLESLSLPFIIMLLAKNQTVSIISYLLRGIFINSSIPLYTSYYMELMEDEVKAIASSIKEISWNLAWAIGSSIFGIFKGNYFTQIMTFFAFYSMGILSFYLLGKKNAKIMIL